MIPRSFRVLLLAVATYATPCAHAGGFLRDLDLATRQVKAVQREVGSPILTDAKEAAVKVAPPEIVAVRTIEEAQLRNLGEGLLLPPTRSDIRSATSLLDAEPSVRAFHSKLRALSAPVPGNPVNEIANARVYQGAEVGGFLRVVLLLDANGSAVCTGTLVSPQYVLTAAHCLCERPSIRPSATRLTYVAFGSSRTSSEVLGELDPSKAKWMGSGSVCAGSLEDPDIALVGFSSFKALGLPPLRFAEDSDLDRAEALRVIGYGRSNGSITSAGVKRAALVPIVSKDCMGEPVSTPGNTFASVFECVEGRELIAGRFGGADTCKGDSGGPAFLAEVSNAEDMFPSDIPANELRIAAITSRGVKTPDGSLDDCGYGGIYVRITGSVRNFLAIAIGS